MEIEAFKKKNGWIHDTIRSTTSRWNYVWNHDDEAVYCNNTPAFGFEQYIVHALDGISFPQFV